MGITYNVITHGTLTNTNGVLSNFSASNYATLPLNFNQPQQPFEIVFKFNSNNISDEQIILQIGNLTTISGSLDIEVYESKLYSELDSESQQRWYIEGATTLSSNTDYWVKLTYNGIDTYSLYLSTNGTTWTTEGTTTSSYYLGTTEYSYIGIDQSLTTWYFNGSIDLNKSYIDINNIRWWQGVTSTSNVQTRIQLRHDTAANWTSVNPILAKGEIGIDTNNNYVKIGDGSTAWNNLPYATITPEILQVALGDKVDYFEIDSPLIDTWKVNSNTELEVNASVSDSGILTDTVTDDYWALNNTTIGNYIDNQMSYWHIHFKFKTSSNNTVQPFFGIADGVGEYDTNFVELHVRNGYFATSDTTTNVSIPTNTWVEVNIEHIEGASNVSATINVGGTISTVSNVLKNNYTLSLAKGVEWLGLGVTPFEFDITLDGFYVQNALYSAKYCLLTDRHIGVDNTAFDGQWNNSNSGNIINGSNITWTTGHNYDLSSYLPNDGKIYEVIFTASWTGSTANANHGLRASTDIITSAWNWLGRVSGTNVANGTCILPVGSGRYVKLTTDAKACNSVYFSALGYRRLGTNS